MSERKYFDYDETKVTPGQAAKRRYKQRNREKILEDSRQYARKRYANNLERERQRCIDWRKNNPEKLRESEKKSYDSNLEKIRARTQVRLAILDKTMIRPNNCSQCEIECKPEAHHHDYSKPLDVIFLCRKCHMMEHEKLKTTHKKEYIECQK